MPDPFLSRAIELVERAQAAMDSLTRTRPRHNPTPTSRPIPTYTKKPPMPVYARQQQSGRMRPQGSALSFLLMVLGFLGSLPLFLLSLGQALIAASSFMVNDLIASIILLAVSAVFGGVFAYGQSLFRLNRRFRRYIVEIGSASFYDLTFLAKSLSLPLARVQADFRRLARSGAIARAYFDDKMTCVMLDEETYRQYLALEENQKQKALEKQTANLPDQPHSTGGTLAQEGGEYIRRIREANAALSGELITRKLSRLEEVTAQIFRAVEQQPDKQPEIRRLMQYHLPTTLKLVDTYHRMDLQAVQGGNVLRIKEEILASLDTVNDAFAKLLDDLFNDVALDVSSDISVLKTMLAQEGLTGCDDFKRS